MTNEASNASPTGCDDLPRRGWSRGNRQRHVPEAAAEGITRATAERVAADRQPLENAVATNVLRGDRSADRPSPLVIRKDAVQLPGGLICTVLSPGREQLVQPRRKWGDAVYEAKLNPATVTPEEPLKSPGRLERVGTVDVAKLAAEQSPLDNKEANGSSRWWNTWWFRVGEPARVVDQFLQQWLDRRPHRVPVHPEPPRD